MLMSDSKPHATYFGQNAISKLLNNMIKESEYCSKVFQTQFNKPLVWLENIMKILNILQIVRLE